ncbi:MAG: adenosine deaminase [Nitrospiraceae bacterium]|nr:MAG: adenosine deaminase [Nitrospiraceae bacterium]
MRKEISIEDFIRGIPKAELHLHIEGTFEPELMFEIAGRNTIQLKQKSIEEIREAYKFSNLQDFLDIYYQGAGILTEEKDFYDLTSAYLEKAASQNVLHSEIFFDPQTHTGRGIKFSTVVNGIQKACADAREKLGISTGLIMCFLRDLDETDAMKTLEDALAYRDRIAAVGLDSAEIGNPPAKFREVFNRARDAGFLTVAHGGEEGPAEYVREALELLKVSRIDHGNHCLDDYELAEELIRRRIPLTVCPLSNLRLKVVDSLERHPLRIMMERGLLVTVNSDDPAYFGGYINENYLAVTKALDLTAADIYRLAKNSFEASFLKQSEKDNMLARLHEYIEKGIP